MASRDLRGGPLGRPQGTTPTECEMLYKEDVLGKVVVGGFMVSISLSKGSILPYPKLRSGFCPLDWQMGRRGGSSSVTGQACGSWW